MSIAITQPYCPECGRSVASTLRWAHAMEVSDVLMLDLDAAGKMSNILNVATVDFQCGGCGSPIRIGRDAPLAAA